MIKQEQTEQEIVAPYIEKIREIEIKLDEMRKNLNSPQLSEAERDLITERWRRIEHPKCNLMRKAVWKVAKAKGIDFIETPEESEALAKETAEKYSDSYELYRMWAYERGFKPKKRNFDRSKAYGDIYNEEISSRNFLTPMHSKKPLESALAIEQTAMALSGKLTRDSSIESILRHLALQKRRKIPFSQRSIWLFRKETLSEKLQDWDDFNEYWNGHYNFSCLTSDQCYRTKDAPFSELYDAYMGTRIKGKGSGVLFWAAKNRPEELGQKITELLGKCLYKRKENQSISKLLETEGLTRYTVTDAVLDLQFYIESKIWGRGMSFGERRGDIQAPYAVEDTFRRIEELVKYAHSLYKQEHTKEQK
jgi:hypothetical protein